MKFKWVILVIGTYLIAFSINLFPSMKHPDSMMNISHLLATLLFLFGFLIFIKKSPQNGKFDKVIKLSLILGILSGLIVFVIGMFEGALSNHLILELMTAIQYPSYFLFITPWFGLNQIFDLNYQLFSLIVSVVYLFLLILNFKKTNHQPA